jgi:hypothetical protein
MGVSCDIVVVDDALTALLLLWLLALRDAKHSLDATMDKCVL